MKNFLDEIRSFEEADALDNSTDEKSIFTKGSNPDNGPEPEKTENVAKVDNVDDVFNEYVSDPDPASQEDDEQEPLSTPEEIEGSAIPQEEVEDMIVESPGTVEENDVEMDEENIEVSDDNADVQPTGADDIEEGEIEPIVQPTEENPNGELGVDINQAIEALLRGCEEEIRVIAGDTEITLDEAGKVSVDQATDDSDDSDDDIESNDESNDFDTSSDDDSDDNEESNDEEEKETSEESLDLMRYFSKNFIV